MRAVSSSEDPNFGGAGACIDGNTEDVGNDGVCATLKQDAPWIAIDYGTDVLVEKVEIFNRINCCGNVTRHVYVIVSDELPTSATEKFTGGTQLGHFEGPAADGEIITISGKSNAFKICFKMVSQGNSPLADT